MMPIKKCLLLSCLLAGSVTLCASETTQESEQKLFQSTIQHVDMGGLSLSYQNTTLLNKQLRQLLKQFAAFAESRQDPQTAFLFQAAEQCLNISGLGSLNAVATSLKSETTASETTYATRIYWNTGNNPQGLLYTLIGRQNQPFTLWQMIPDNATYAAGGHIDFTAAWRQFSTQCAASPELTALPELARKQFTKFSGQNLDALLHSISGEYLLAGRGRPRHGDSGLFSMPDRAGSMLALLKKGLGWDLHIAPDGSMQIQTAAGHPPLQIVAQDGRLIISNSVDWARKCQHAGGANTALAQALNAQLPTPGAGIAYVYYNNAPSQLADLIAMWNVPPSITKSFAGNGIHCSGVFFRGTDGYAGELRSNASPVTLSQIVLPSFAIDFTSRSSSNK